MATIASGAAPAGEEFFTFTAQGDGEHWFTVRTVDFEGRGNPPTLTGSRPQCIVVVDTTPPQIDLRSLGITGDEAGIKWSVYDEHLDLGTMRVEFRAGSADWFPVQIQPSPEGTARFRPGTRGPIDLRLRVLDRAGNEGVQLVNMQMLGGPQNSGVGTPGTTTYPPNTSNVPQGIQAFGSQGPPGGYNPSPGLNPSPNLNLPNGMNTQFAPGPSGGSTFTPANPGLTVPPPPTLPPSSLPPALLQDSQAPLWGSILRRVLFFDKSEYSFGPTIKGPTVAPFQYWVRQCPGTRSRAVGVDTDGSPVRNNLQLVDSTRFGINYEIAEVGRSGIGGISLYWTYDGITWNYHGDDEDQQSPFQIEVDGEGTFGFKIVARSKAGLGDDPPRPGDQPDVWVEVDITPPEIDLKPPQPGRGASSGVLDIEWQAHRQESGPQTDQPLLCGGSERSLKPIAEGIENSGRYQWQIPSDPSMPYEVFRSD